MQKHAVMVCVGLYCVFYVDKVLNCHTNTLCFCNAPYIYTLTLTVHLLCLVLIQACDL